MIAAAGFMLAPAVWNGFPFMFYDTAAFISQAVAGGFVAERSVFYAWFLAATGLSVSLWPAMLAQTLMTALVIAVFFQRVAPAPADSAVGRRAFLPAIAILCIGTALPWFAAQVLPDIFAPLLVLCLYLLGFYGHTLSRPLQAALFAIAALAAASHASHLGLAAGLTAVAAFLQMITRGSSADPVRPDWRWPAAVFAAALLALVASNFVRTGQVFVSRAGPAFILGRLVQDGIVKHLLDDTCPESGYRLCEYKDDLPTSADDYLWGATSPFLRLGGFEGGAVESRSIIAESLRRYPWTHVRTALVDTVRQFTSFATGDGIEPQQFVLMPILTELTPHYLDAYTAARQQNGLIAFSWLNAIHVPVGYLSLAVLIGMLAGAVYGRDRGDRLHLPAFVLAALVGNAFICGALSNPHDRYQSRLMWVASLSAIVLVKLPLRQTRAVIPMI